MSHNANKKTWKCLVFRSVSLSFSHTHTPTGHKCYLIHNQHHWPVAQPVRPVWDFYVVLETCPKPTSTVNNFPSEDGCSELWWTPSISTAFPAPPTPTSFLPLRVLGETGQAEEGLFLSCSPAKALHDFLTGLWDYKNRRSAQWRLLWIACWPHTQTQTDFNSRGLYFLCLLCRNSAKWVFQSHLCW